MNNLYREQAPITHSAWEQIETEARRVVDVAGPKGIDYSAVGTGHLQNIQSPGDGVQAAQRLAKALVELRVPFELTRQAIDDVERGAADPDWSPLKDAALKLPLQRTAPSSKGTPQQEFKASGGVTVIPW
ncbi:MAG TPA: family 1 encapsulin nanocompartment shell protein [Puia sp.]|nr:family 1 encapsulin nanocompartment shell protein [Puia sp.]